MLCVICRHILKLLRVILGHWGFNNQPWHRRLLKKFYHAVLVTLKRVGGSKKPAAATISAEVWKEWLSHAAVARCNVPISGIFTKTKSPEDDRARGDGHGDTGEIDDFGSSDRRSDKRNKRKRGDRSEEDCLTKFTAIMHDCKRHPAERASFYQHMCDWQVARGRGAVPGTAGAPQRDRTRGAADPYKKSHKKKTSRDKQDSTKPSKSKHKKHKHQTDVSSHSHVASSVHDGAAGAASNRNQPREVRQITDPTQVQRYLKKHGAQQGWILELFPNEKHVPPPLPTDRWFMEVEDGRAVTEPDGDIVIAKCRWMKTNSCTERDPEFRNAYPCDIESVKACGPPSSFAPPRTMFHDAHGAWHISSQ